MHVSASEPSHPAFSPLLLNLSVSGHAGWEGRMLLTIRGQGPQRELWQRFPRGMPSSLRQEHTQVLPLMSLKKQRVSCTCSFAFPGHQSLLQSPALLRLLRAWGQPTWRNQGTVPSQRQEQDLPLCITSSALLSGGLLLTCEMGD